jgi:hypothetical protein
MDVGEGPEAFGGFPRRLILVIAAVAAGAQLFGFLLRDGTVWGADGYGFLAPAVMFVAGLLLVGVTILVVRWRTPSASLALERDNGAARPIHSFWIYGALALAGAALFGLFHAAHVFLGDGVVMVTTIPLQQKTFHPLEPLSQLLEQATYLAVKPFLARPGLEPHEVAWIGVGGLSVVAGAFFLPAVWAVALRLMRRVPQASIAGGRGDLALGAMVFLALVSQGYVQIFFGYVEVYALVAASLAVYVLTALRFLDDRRPLWPVALALAVAIACHLSALVLLPSFALLATLSVIDPERRGRLRGDALWSGAVLAALPLGLALLENGYNLGQTAMSLVSAVLFRQPEPLPGYFWSWRHLTDIVNVQLLVGPLAMGFFVPVVISTLRRPAARTFETAFFVLLGAGFVAVGLVAGDSNLGYARNWDLLAPGGFVLATAGMALLLPRFAQAGAARSFLTLAVAASLFHTIPWIAVNASADRALKRFTTLPLELGRVESTVGYWFTLTGDVSRAEQWLVRALEEYPGNVRAHMQLGELYSKRGEHRRACESYSAAVAISPDSDEFRLQLVGEQVRAGMAREALPEAERLVRRQPGNPRFWTVYGIVLLGTAQTDAARYAFQVASRNAPYSLLYRLMGNYADLPHGFERAVDEVLEVLLAG